MDEEIMIETAELTTHILPPKKEKALIIPIVAKEATSLKNFFNMYYQGRIVEPASKSNIKVQQTLDLNKSSLVERTFQQAEKYGDGVRSLENSPWSAWGYTNSDPISVGQLYDFSALGGVNYPRIDQKGSKTE